MSTQAEYSDGDKLYGVDMDNVIEALSNDGILTGWTLAQNATPNMSVDVAAGTGFIGNTYRTTVSTTNVGITASHGSLDRLDIIVINSSGTISAIAGTPAASPNPPDLPDANICLAIIIVDATVTAIYDADIVSKRLLVGGIKDQHFSGTLSWNKVSKSGSNLNEIATRSHTVLSDKGSNTHPAIDSHITTVNTHMGDQSDPHGSTMTITTKVVSPKLQQTGDVEIESTGADIILNPSGRTRSLDDIRMESSEIILRYGSTDVATLSAVSADTAMLDLTSGEFYGGVRGKYVGIISTNTDGYILFEVDGGVDIMKWERTNGVTFMDDMQPDDCGNLDFGESGKRLNNVYCETLNEASCDVAEWYVGEPGEPGEVFVLDPESGIAMKSTRANDPQVIGAYSTKPGVILGNEAYIQHRGEIKKIKEKAKRKILYAKIAKDWKEIHVLIGLIGKIPIKTVGTVNVGDLLISSEKQGHARTITPEDATPLFILGRALTPAKNNQSEMFIQLCVMYHNPLVVE